jgi:hypothetical protein
MFVCVSRYVWVCRAEFHAYTGGVYARQLLGQEEKRDRHAVAVIGYGLDNGIQYRLFANSWGTVLPLHSRHICTVPLAFSWPSSATCVA